MLDEKYKEILQRLKDQNISIEGKNVIVDNTLNGQYISGYTISKNKKWLCCPVLDEEVACFIGSYEYKPQCFEIEDIYETYLKNGDWINLTQVIILK